MAKGTMIIDGQRVAFDGEKNVLSVIKKAGIDIPTLCYYSDLSIHGACRMCIVETDKGKIEASCSLEPRDGMSIKTNSARLLKHRRMILQLLLASHNCDCKTCGKSGLCQLQDLAWKFGIRSISFKDTRPLYEMDESSPALLRDPNKCILCGDCVRACEEQEGMGIIDFVGRGSSMTVAPAFNRKLAQTKCISCGQCAAVCPTGAITTKNQIGEAWAALHNKNLRTVFQIAPAVRTTLGEAFDIPVGENVLFKLTRALMIMGADEVYDTNFAADLTTIEESNEFLERLKVGGPFPMFTSCCPAWVKYLENFEPKYLKNISTCKSPMEMFAAMLREKYAAKDAEDGRKTFHIAIMPCTAKKMEAAREEFCHDGQPDVDLVLTVRELMVMIKEVGIDLKTIDTEAPDMPFGLGSGSANLYGTTGGVAESVLRYCFPDKTKNGLNLIDSLNLGADAPVKEATVTVGDQELKIAVVNGLGNVRGVLDAIESGEKFYHIVEVMTCPGGCSGGAGTPHVKRSVKFQRGAGLHDIDNKAAFKIAEHNPYATSLINELGHEKEHELFHVSYVKEDK